MVASLGQSVSLSLSGQKTTPMKNCSFRFTRSLSGKTCPFIAITKAHATEFIKALPQGFDTLVGERGIKLSGSQKQRIVIARVILKDAPVMVFDEATSALDSESEKIIQDALPEIIGKRTAIIIA